MKRYFSVLLLLLTWLTSPAQSSFIVGDYNIRYNNPEDAKKGAAWADRLPHICDMVNYEGWDIFCAQEVLDDQLQDLLKGLDGYDYIGVGRIDGKKAGEYAPILYRKSRMRCISNGNFWLSETPDVVGSKGWDADQRRICTWGLFEDKSTKWQFWVFNLHLDHVGWVARRESAKLVLTRIEEMCDGKPYILTGDFNVDQDDEIYGILVESGKLADTHDVAKHRMAKNGTINSFKTERYTKSRIDHIFVSPEFTAHGYGILTYHYWAPAKEGEKEYKPHVLSDHYPVEVRLELPRLRSPQDWAQYGNYENKNSETKRPEVVFMGNSITSNWYRFHPEFFHENNYAGRGISGQVTAQMLARFRSDVIDLKPDKVVILAGTNDIAMNQGYVSIEHIFENIVSMAELAEHNDIEVVLCSVLPADRFSWSWEISSERAKASIKELNDLLRTYAKKNGLKYADYYSAMADENLALKKEYQQDAVHPNKAGYLVMEEIIQAILKK